MPATASSFATVSRLKMTFFHGNVYSRAARPHRAYPRYVAVLDVLGMKSWLEHESPQRIAEKLDEALVACNQASSGEVNGFKYGPIIQITHFSDTLLAWSPDDSWASLAVICSTVKMIVGSALHRGVPLRGAISFGDVVCCKDELRFVGPPIADAFQWAENQRHYRSVGADITPSTITHIREKLTLDPIPACFDNDSEIPSAVLMGTQRYSGNLLWHGEELFINHWNHGMFLRCNPLEMFFQRGLPKNDGADTKATEMLRFYDASEKLKRVHYVNNSMSYLSSSDSLEQEISEYLRLESIKNHRSPF